MNSMLPHSDKPLLSEGWSWLWIIFVTLAVLMSGIHLADAAPLSKPQQLTSPDQVPEGLAKSDWSSIRAAYEAGRHQFFKQDDGSHVASNPGLGWKMEFDERGFTAKPNDGGWEWGLELQRDADTPVCTSASEGEKSPSNTLQRRLTPAITEWFINDRRGLEQGWTLSAPAEIRLRVRGNLKPTVSPQSVRFGDQITYSGLKAWDATGKTILTHFEATEEGFAVRYDDAGAQYPLTIDPIAQQAYLKPAAIGTTQAGDNFGGSVAISGDTVVVGALYEDGNFTGVNSAVNDGTSDYGAAYVFVRSGATWSQQAYLKASQVTAGDQFGYSVAISGDTVVVGSLFEDGSTAGVNGTVNESASNSGAAYVFVRNGTTWSQQAYLKASQVTGNDQFGYSVAVSGETVVIGAPFENGSAAGVNGTVDEGAADAGAAFVFVRNGTVWSQQAYLKASEVTTLDFFGRSVAVAGDTVVVGANGEDGSSPGVNGAVDEAASAAGAAYVFVRNGTTWTQEAYLKASQVNDSDAFGVAVAVSSDTIVVGSPGEDSSATGINQMIDEGALGAGAAYVFVRTGTIWSQQAYLKPAAVGTTQAGDDFGRSVAVDGDTVVVGASLEDGGIPGVNGTPNQSRDSSGAAYVFTRGGTTWVQQAYLKASQVSSSDQFGAAVAIAGGTVVVGALGEDGSATGVNGTENESAADAGAAYVFTGLGPAPEIAVEHPAATNLVDGGATIDFGTSALAATGVTKTFTIRNLGILDLTGLSVMKSGLNASEFVINTTGMSTTLAYGVSTTFSVTFTPSLLGNRSAVLQITSNDDDETPFDISLSGVGTGSGAQAISFSSASDIPITANGLTATGSTLDFTLNFAPATGANLTVVNNTSLNFINGTFSNLAQGQVVNLSYGGVVYPYVANYHGGTGNDLVFVWKNNRAYAWGNNSSNQLGVSVATPLGYLTQPTPVDATGVLAGKTILSLAGGPEWTIALCSDGTLAAWGKNDYGQLGINSVVSPQPLPVLVNTTQGISALYGKSVIAIAASSAYSCLALCSDGTIASWGRNSQGQLGNGSTNDSTVPVAVRTTGSALSGKTVVAIASGTAHSLALCSDGTIAAWGDGSNGSLGNGFTNQQHSPYAVTQTGPALSSKSVVAIGAGYYNGYALCSDGTISAWGINGSPYALGDGSTTDQTSPVAVNVSLGNSALYGKFVTAIAVSNSCCRALCSDGTLTSWGLNGKRAGGGQ
jgi:alpha-tubulin suppressor-like RCC1 family protein